MQARYARGIKSRHVEHSRQRRRHRRRMARHLGVRVLDRGEVDAEIWGMHVFLLGLLEARGWVAEG